MIKNDFLVNVLFVLTFLTFGFYVYNRKKFEIVDQSNPKIRTTTKAGTICYVIMIFEVFVLTVVLAITHWGSLLARFGLN